MCAFWISLYRICVDVVNMTPDTRGVSGVFYLLTSGSMECAGGINFLCVHQFHSVEQVFRRMWKKLQVFVAKKPCCKKFATLYLKMGRFATRFGVLTVEFCGIYGKVSYRATRG